MATKQAKTRIKKGDTVQLISGRSQKNGGDRGKTGKVISVDTETGRALVEGINRVTKHTKVGQSNRGSRTGGIITTEASIHLSNLMLVDPETKKPTRVGIRVETADRDGRQKTVRVRVAKRSGKDL
ncbi:50S ribosomal protein L24 [Spongisporangium articulatum]|uniref:Large ribosomal subunit protein uL24 n=1 Tax=Spongisporangium articulatum TaxID=3362603 RepID=A0ABW8AP10_9ACTN